MNSEEFNNARQSQNILRSLAQNGPANNETVSCSGRRADSVPVSSSKPRRRSRLAQIGLPEDTFDCVVIVTDLITFQRRWRELQSSISCSTIYSDADLRAMARSMKRELRLGLIEQHNAQLSSVPAPTQPSRNRRSSSTSRKNSTVSSVEDDEVYQAMSTSIPNLLTQQSSSNLRSSSALATSSSRIPTPLKSIPIIVTSNRVSERPRSKMEMRIQRRMSCDTNTPHQNIDRLKLLQRKHSTDVGSSNMVQFPEEF